MTIKYTQENPFYISIIKMFAGTIKMLPCNKTKKYCISNC